MQDALGVSLAAAVVGGSVQLWAQGGEVAPGFIPGLLSGIGLVKQGDDFAVARFFVVQLFQQLECLLVSAVLDVDFSFSQAGQVALLLAGTFTGTQQVVITAVFGVLPVGGNGSVFVVDNGVLTKRGHQASTVLKVAFGTTIVARQHGSEAAFQQALGFVTAAHAAATAEDLRAVPENAEYAQAVEDDAGGDQREDKPDNERGFDVIAGCEDVNALLWEQVDCVTCHAA